MGAIQLPSIKNTLMSDFGMELNIAGGNGQSDKPIVVLDENPEDALRTQLQVLTGLGEGRRVQWKVLESTPFPSIESRVNQVRIETKQLTETEIISQVENYYFDTSAAGDQSNSINLTVYTHPQTGVQFPFELGWLHFDRLIDHEPGEAGAGQTVRYIAPGIEASFHLYDKQLPDIPGSIDSMEVQQEFLENLRDLKQANPLAEPIGEPEIGGGFLIHKFVNLKYFSLVGLTVCSGSFVKYRITYIGEAFIQQVVMASLTVFMTMIESMRHEHRH